MVYLRNEKNIAILKIAYSFSHSSFLYLTFCLLLFADSLDPDHAPYMGLISILPGIGGIWGGGGGGDLL